MSHTTRKPRVGEADSGNYVFVSEEDFEKMRSNVSPHLDCCSEVTKMHNTHIYS